MVAVEHHGEVTAKMSKTQVAATSILMVQPAQPLDPKRIPPAEGSPVRAKDLTYATHSQPVQIPTIVGTCWLKAVEMWDKSCKDTNENCEVSDLRGPVKVEDLIDAALRASEKWFSKQASTKSTVYRNILSLLKNHSKAIDVFIQSQPHISSLVWGSVRILLQVALDNERVSELTADGILHVAQDASRWADMARQFVQEEAVEGALIETYFHMLGFLIPARHACESKGISRLKSIAFENAKDQVQVRLNKLEKAERRLVDAIQWKSTQYLVQEAEDRKKNTQAQRTNPHEDLCGQHSQCLSRSNSTMRDWIMEQSNEVSRPRTDLVSADTTLWLLNDAKFQNWINGEASSILWICGKAGNGKTYLANRLRSHLQDQANQTITLSHAFKANESVQDTRPAALVISIVSQLLPNLPFNAQQDILKTLRDLGIKPKMNLDECPLPPLWDICAELVHQQKQFTLIIDGLDECKFENGDEGKSFLKLLSSLTSNGEGKMAIFTRPSALFSVGTTSEACENEIRITPATTLDDLRECCRKSAQKPQIPKQDQEKVADKIAAAADGSFLFASLFFKKLGQATTRKKLEEMIANPPQNHQELLLEDFTRQTDGLDKEQKSDLMKIIFMLLSAQRRLEVSDVRDGLDFLENSVEFLVSQYCRSLITITDGYIHLGHTVVKDILLDENGRPRANVFGFDTWEEPDEVTAKACLEYLLKQEYNDPDSIGKMLQDDVKGLENDDESFYDYASRYWYIHLGKVLSPSRGLIDLARRFILSRQFVYWAEYCYNDSNDLQATRSAERRLTIWNQSLPLDLRDILPLSEYYETPYDELNQVFKEERYDRRLQWLVLLKLGDYHFDRAQFDKMDKVRQAAAQGLIHLLGPKAPLSMRARSDAACSSLYNGDLMCAHRQYSEVAHDQRNSPAGESASLFYTLVYMGQAEYLLNRNKTAKATLSAAYDGFSKLTGLESPGALGSELWLAHVHAAEGDLAQARDAMEHVRFEREKLYGPDDSFAVTTQLFLGEVYRHQGKDQQALACVKRGFAYMRQSYPATHILAVDSSIQLIVVYREYKMHDEAIDLVTSVENEGGLNGRSRFERLCQTTHLKALLFYDEGKIDQAVNLLQSLLLETDRTQNNRTLLWVRMDLADMLRSRGRDGDEQIASSIFQSLVTKHDQPGDEPDPPRLLCVAEKALRLIRAENSDGAKHLLEREELTWARDKDFWRLLGAPGADTMKLRSLARIDSGFFDSS